MWIGTMNGLNRFDGREFSVMLPKFGSLSIGENRIRSIEQDSNGFLWILTNSDIVSCYDTHKESFVDYNGNGETRYFRNVLITSENDVWLWGTQSGCCRIRYNKGKPETIFFSKSNIDTDVVNFVYEASDKHIWIGTDKGLIHYAGSEINFCDTGKDIFNFNSAVELGKNIYFFTNNNKILVLDKLKKNQFYRITISKEYSNNLKLNQTIALDNSKILITSRFQTFVFDINSSDIVSSEPYFDNRKIMNAYFIISNKGDICLYNKTGSIWNYDRENKKFREYKLIPESILPFIDLERYAVYHDSRGIIWITTYGNGLFAIEHNTGKISHFDREVNGLQTNHLLSVCEDKSGEIWIGTEYAGMSKISMTNYKNKVFYPDKNENNALNRVIRTILEDRKGDIWLGARNGNVYVMDKDLNNKKIINLMGIPYSIAEDSVGNKWIGTKGAGLYIISSKDYSVKESHLNRLNDKTSLPNNNIYSIMQDSKGRMWLGTFGGGIVLCERNTDGKLEFRKFPSVNTNQNRIRSLIQDRTGQIWVGGNHGIVVFNPDEILKDATAFTCYFSDTKNPESLNNNEVKTIFEDSDGQIWIGTSGGGISMAVKEEQTGDYHFENYSSHNGLANDIIQAIMEDSKRNLWISTESGISKLNIDTKNIENYSFSNNWEGDLFCESSSFKRKNGDLMFGSHDGLYILNPLSFEGKSYVPPVALTNLRINGAIIKPEDKDSPLKMTISESKSIRLKSDQNTFSIEFSSLNYQQPYANRYSYILEGYEKKWNPVSSYNVATYKNIPAGKYLFKVKGCNSSGVWNENQTVLEIIVVPPFWKSTSAMIVYLLLFIVSIFFALRLAIKMNRLHNAVEIEKQMTDYRLRFFTNISHEFRTPLTIIRGTIENLTEMENLSSVVSKHIKTLDKSSSRLLRLIDQLLEFRRLQNNKMELNLEYTEAVVFFRDICNVFKETTQKKKIDFTFTSSEQERKILLDRSKMDKIAYNLLSNAFKYTPEGGEIKMEIIFDMEADKFILRISDSGIGIPKEKQAMLFVRFTQINYSSSGTGIGLHFTSELVNIHKGSIKYSDSETGGACFTVTVPLSDISYDKEDIVLPVEENKRLEELSGNDKVDRGEEFGDDSENPDKSLKKYKLLVVEDDDEVREFLKNKLEEYFTIITAENGLDGLEKAQKEQPHLIICDVMMPEMDGFQVTRNLKSEFQTSHIPIILLTAHSSMEHQLEGIEAGADAYIIKPFSMKYLMARVVKLIEQREILQRKFAKDLDFAPPGIYVTDKDKDFLEKIHEIIEQNLANPDFSVDLFAQSVNMGRTLFYKKIKGITGYSPNEYLRVMRMKKAANLLLTTHLNVSEVSYKVGINDPFYFSKCFKAQFGKSPSSFIKGNTQSDPDVQSVEDL